MNNLKEFKSLLKVMNTRADITFERVSHLVDYYLTAEETELEEMRGLISLDFGKYLIGFTKEFSEKVITTKDAVWLQKGYGLHLLENCQFDYRHNLCELFYLDYSALRAGFNDLEVWNSIEKLSTEITKKYIKPKKPISERNITPDEILKGRNLREKAVNGMIKLVKE